MFSIAHTPADTTKGEGRRREHRQECDEMRQEQADARKATETQKNTLGQGVQPSQIAVRCADIGICPVNNKGSQQSVVDRVPVSVYFYTSEPKESPRTSFLRSMTLPAWTFCTASDSSSRSAALRESSRSRATCRLLGTSRIE